MSDLTIKTNKHWRNFSYRNEVPESILKSQFDWTNEAHETDGDYSDNFFQYRGYWYHLADFMRFESDPGNPMAEWHGYAGDSYFSGTLIRVSEDGEQYQVARYYS